jgi:nucleoside-diphosphate-sugar epimerase
MSRIAVTGGLGKLGRAVVADLREHGHDVLVLDRAAVVGADEAVIAVDLTDFGQVVGALTGLDDRHSGLDAVVHLAAIPAPGLAPNATILANNVLSTYHVFEASRIAGINTIVFASSETLLGLPFDAPPPYAPLDEEYRVRPESAYSLGKALDEELAFHMARWNPELSITGMRFSNVMEPADYAEFPSFESDPTLRRWNLWSYIDARDGAQAVRLAVEQSRPGYEVFLIANADTVMASPSVDLMAREFPDVPMRREVPGNETLMSIDKARRLLGYEPRFTWRREA